MPWVFGPRRMASPQKQALLVYQGSYPWEVRIEKFCRVLNECGFHCTVLCRWTGEQLENEHRPGVDIIRLGFGLASWKSLPSSANPLWRRAIRAQVERLQPSLIVAREMLIAEACTAAAAGRIPVLMDMAEHYPAAMRSWKKYRSSWYGRLLVHHWDVPSRIERNAIKKMDAIVCVCQENMDRLQKSYHIASEKLALVMNTPALHEFDQVRLGPSHPARVFSYQGYITRERGVERCIQAFSELARTIPDIEFVVAGSGESYGDVLTMQQASPAADRIHLLGSFRHEELSSILSKSDVGLIVFDQDEFRQHTIPNKLFDYLLCAKPVIVSACAPMARIVQEYSCGIVVDTNSPDQLRQSMARMCQEDLSTMSNNARKAATERFHWELDAQRLKDCILSLL